MYQANFKILILLLFSFSSVAYAVTWTGPVELQKKEIYSLHKTVVYYFSGEDNYFCTISLDADKYMVGQKFNTVAIDYGHCVLLEITQEQDVIMKYLGLLAGILAGFAIVRWWSSLM